MANVKLYSHVTARTTLLLMALCGAVPPAGAQEGSVSGSERSLPSDLSVAVVDQTIKDHPTPSSLGPWGYTRGLTLYAIEKVYERTRDPRYLRYIQAWADAHVNAQGEIDHSIDALDDIQPGMLMISLYRDTGEQRYKLAAERIRKRFDTYPRTQDGGLWHGAVGEHQHQLWLDGMYMSMPFLVQYGELFGDQKYAYSEATKQLLLYARHLNDPNTGLLFHAYDELGTQPWAQPSTHHSSYFWGRSIGWYGMALIEVLETMPKDDPGRPKLIALMRQLVSAFERFKDPKTGLWYDVVDKPNQPGNWLESSASSMYIYVISRAVQRGYVQKSYESVACRAYHGMLSQLIANSDHDVSVPNICAGSVVGDLPYYLARPRNTDDIHGIGAFLLMNEQMRSAPCARKMREH
jgi:unsaturated rhamnogalacturonyl hydrolase